MESGRQQAAVHRLPDGHTIAWLRDTSRRGTMRWGIFRMAADGSAQAAVIDDGEINSRPAWSPDGARIHFHRTPAIGAPFNIWSIRPDGSGLQPTIWPPPAGYDNEYPVSER